MKNEYPKLEKGKIEEFYNSLKNDEKKLIDEYMIYRQARGLNDKSMFKNVRRMILQPRYILEKPVQEMTLQDLRKILSIINNSDLSNHYKNNVKVNFKNYIKYVVPDWSMKFSNLDDIKTSGVNQHNEEKINHGTLFTKEDIDKLLKAEQKIRWRTFLLLQYEGGLRTIETRRLKWSDIKIDVGDGLTEINIYATKNQKARTLYVKEATHYLKLFLQEQESKNDKGTYIFHGKYDKNVPLTKYGVNRWFKELCETTLGRYGWNYLLRHSRASELYGLADKNMIAKDTAIKFMGHGSDMSKVYNHQNPEDVKKMLRDQVYNIENLPEQNKHELELKIEKLEKEKAVSDKRLVEVIKTVNELQKAFSQLAKKV